MQAFKSIARVVGAYVRAFIAEGFDGLFMVLTIGLMGMPMAATAISSEARLVVSVTVAQHASLQVLAQPAMVLITATDVARGYVDVSSPARLVVQSNTQDGYILMFDNQAEFLRQILVKGLDSDVQLSVYGGGVAQRAPGHGMRKTLLVIMFRFVLSDAARQGAYAWPIRLSVTPL